MLRLSQTIAFTGTIKLYNAYLSSKSTDPH